MHGGLVNVQASAKSHLPLAWTFADMPATIFALVEEAGHALQFRSSELSGSTFEHDFGSIETSPMN